MTAGILNLPPDGCSTLHRYLQSGQAGNCRGLLNDELISGKNLKLNQALPRAFVRNVR